MGLDWGAIGWILAVIALLGIYPISYMAYRGFAAEEHKKRLKDDFRLLGLVQEGKLDAAVQELYQTAYNPGQFIPYIFLIVLVSVLILVGYAYKSSLSFISNETISLVFFSYLGAYTFSVQELIRRYNTFDLQPQVYSSIITRILVSVCISFVGSSLILATGGTLSSSNNGQGTAMAWAATAAFVIGIFPSAGIHWLQQQANQILNSKGNDFQTLPLQDIQGISALHEARLSEMGIDDVQNLATIDIRKILLTTRFDTQTIINWIDQAILYSKVGTKYHQFTNAGIVTFHELCQHINKLSFHDPLTNRSVDELKLLEDERKMLSARLGLAGPSELERLGDYSNYPNYAYIAEYYLRTSRIARQRASEGMGILLGTDPEEKDFKNAIDELERRIRHNRQDIDALVNLSTAYYGLNYQEKALVVLGQAIAIDSNMAIAYTNRARIFIDQCKYDEAVRDCTRSILIDNRDKHVYNHRGIALTFLNCLDEAISSFEEALNLDVRFAAAYLNRGLAYNAQGLFDKAKKDFEFHYLLNKNNNFELWLGWGTTLLGVGDYLNAIQKLSRAISYEHPAVASAYSKRGYAYLQIENFDRARNDFDIALEKNKNLLEAYDNLGLLETHLENFEKAIAIYKNVLLQDPKRFTTRYNLAKVYYRLEQFDSMKNEFEQVIQDSPSDSVEASDAKEILATLSVVPFI